MARGATGEIESPIPGTYMMVDLLNPAVKGSETMSFSSEVVIFGGAKLALEVASKCKQSGADKITIVCREDRSDSSITDADVEALGIGGLDIVYTAGLHRLRGEADSLMEIDLIDTLTRKVSTLPAQSLIIAAGRFPELIFVENNPTGPADGETAEQPLRWEAFAPYKQPAFKDEVGLFAEGDVLADYSALAVCGEIERGFSKDSAQAEASRCLQCGLICYEHSGQPAKQEEADAGVAS
jgi:NADPH-dependent glutamate synthase beta subunit-like oxidoreductase